MTSNGVLGRALRVVVYLMTLGIAACGGGGSSTTSTPPPSPVTLTSLAPAALNAGATATVLTATGTAGGNALQGYSGLSAGDGLLVVPAGNIVTAYVLSTNP